MELNSVARGIEDHHKKSMELNSVASGIEDHHKENKEKEREQSDDEDDESLQEEEEAKKTWGEKMHDVKTFLWNPESRQFMGRTAGSWAKILSFYLVFYAFLAGMFSFCMYVMLLTISPYAPTYNDRVFPPGVMIKPYMDGFDFVFNASESSTWSSHVERMHSFLEAYNDSLQSTKNIECEPGKYFWQPGPDAEQKKACQFKRSMLQNCSGIEDPTFGYSVGQPCLFLKMNRIVGFEAGFGTPIYVTCEPVKGEKSDLNSVYFYPENGTFDLMYYPFYGKLTHVNYTSPLVAVHFTDVRKNHLVTVECKLNGKEIVNDNSNDRFLGRIIFTLEIGV